MFQQKYLARLILAVVVLGAGWWLLWYSASPQPTKFPHPIPPGAKLLDSFHHVGGYNEHTYAFVFEVSDKKLLNHLIKRWNLEDHSSDYFSGSFASMKAEFWEVTWWPTRDELAAMPIRYEFTDMSTEVYHTVYCGHEPDRLYVEFGNW